MGIEGFIPWILAIMIALLCLRRIRKNARGRPWTAPEYYAIAIEIGLYSWLAIGFFDDESNLDPAYWFLALAVILVRVTQGASTEQTVPAEELLLEAQG
jgi:hypothetical protein